MIGWMLDGSAGGERIPKEGVWDDAAAAGEQLRPEAAAPSVAGDASRDEDRADCVCPTADDRITRHGMSPFHPATPCDLCFHPVWPQDESVLTEPE